MACWNWAERSDSLRPRASYCPSGRNSFKFAKKLSSLRMVPLMNSLLITSLKSGAEVNTRTYSLPGSS